MKWILMVVMILKASAAGAASFALIAGGGAKSAEEPVDYFSDDFIHAYRLFSHSGKAIVLYGDPAHTIPAHEQGLNRLTEIYGKAPPAFNRKNFFGTLKSISDQAKKNDQVVLVFSSHGYPVARRKSCRDHFDWERAPGTSICVMYGNSPDDLLNLNELKPIRDQFRARGVHFAIIVLTCHSAFALPLADDNTCLVTETGTDKSDGYFARSFWSVARNGMNLEEAAFRAALQTKWDLPHVSTLNREVDDVELTQESKPSGKLNACSRIKL